MMVVMTVTVTVTGDHRSPSHWHGHGPGGARGSHGRKTRNLKDGLDSLTSLSLSDVIRLFARRRPPAGKALEYCSNCTSD
jgi:hypothetical protein